MAEYTFEQWASARFLQAFLLEVDPVIVEKLFSKIEDRFAPILKALDEGQGGPTRQEMDALLFFIALQWARVPSFRPIVEAVADRIHKSNMGGSS